jgi:hypothetical protein
VDVHPATGSTTTEVTFGWTVTTTGPLVTPPAVAVTVAVPEIGFPEASLPLHTMKLAFHVPAQISVDVVPVCPLAPAGDAVVMLVLDELKVILELTAVPEAFSGLAVIVATSPALREIWVGLIRTCATVLAVDELLCPPQPVNAATVNAMNPGMMANRLMHPPRTGFTLADS